MDIADDIGAVFVHMAVQTELHTLLPQLFQKSVITDFLVARDRMKPDGDAHHRSVLCHLSVSPGFGDLLIGFEQASARALWLMLAR
jgi:hypothetical protein